MSALEKIDYHDRILLETLQENGRASNVELSDKTGLSAPQCYRRTRRLETDGIIRGYAAQITPAAIGFDAIGYVGVMIDRAQCRQTRELEKSLRAFPEVLECYAIAGDVDYLLKVAARDLREFSAFLNERLMQTSGISHVRSMLCLEEIKSCGPLPIAGKNAADAGAVNPSLTPDVTD